MKVVLIGDSIRKGYQPLVTRKLADKADVWGPAENCRHSLWALDHFQQWVADQKPDIVHVNFGIHDCVVMEDGQFQILLEQYCLCLRRFIARTRQIGARMVWATTTPRYVPQDGRPMSEWPKMHEIDKYNAAALKIVQEAALSVNDLHQVILDNDYTRCITEDGCHMSALGNEVLSDAVAKALVREMGKVGAVPKSQ